uniref:FF domain-containing protein n=1 Tax=Lactuca sativa TaxID=4236 RepID=A0A9R1V425_LACSA|nr:hypothetical protein LSAT_V11C700348570 [Lactuca sativa]
MTKKERDKDLTFDLKRRRKMGLKRLLTQGMWMEEHVASGMLTSKSHWREYCNKVKELPAYLAVASNSSGASPKDLFEDYIEDRDRIKAAVKMRKVYMSSSWTLEEFKNAIVEDITSPTVWVIKQEGIHCIQVLKSRDAHGVMMAKEMSIKAEEKNINDGEEAEGSVKTSISMRSFPPVSASSEDVPAVAYNMDGIGNKTEQPWRLVLKGDTIEMSANAIGLTMESNGIRILEPFDTSIKFSNASGKTNIHVAVSDIFMNFSFNTLRLFLAVEEDILKFLRMTSRKMTVSCSKYEPLGFRMFSNEDVTIGAWMLAMNVNHEENHQLCQTECTPTSIAVWDLPKCLEQNKEKPTKKQPAETKTTRKSPQKKVEKRKSKTRGQKGKKNESEKEKEQMKKTQQSEGRNDRCTPRALLSVIQGFNEVQKDSVRQMGFMKMKEVQGALSCFVLKNFNSETKKIVLQRGVIDVTKESFSKLPFRTKEDKCYQEWTNQFEDKKMT